MNIINQLAWHTLRILGKINDLKDDFFDKFELIYRAHPGTNEDTSINPKVKVISEKSLYDWLSVVDLNVSRVSTALFESEICRVPSLRYSPVEYPAKFLTYGLDKFTAITNLSQISEALVTNLGKFMENSRNYEIYYGIVDGKSTERTVSELINILENGMSSYNRESVDLNGLVFTFRKCLTNFLSMVSIKYNIKQGKTRIKSLSLFKNDIPKEWYVKRRHYGKRHS
ncbi:MAG: hypothetical protein PHI90_07590 [Clostridia bacterium]|nr:hypothetical protein [Clostridia bacterium]